MAGPKCLKGFAGSENGNLVDKELVRNFVDIEPLSGPEAGPIKLYQCSQEDCAFRCGVLLVGGMFNVMTTGGECILDAATQIDTATPS